MELATVARLASPTVSGSTICRLVPELQVGHEGLKNDGDLRHLLQAFIGLTRCVLLKGEHLHEDKSMLKIEEIDPAQYINRGAGARDRQGRSPSQERGERIGVDKRASTEGETMKIVIDAAAVVLALQLAEASVASWTAAPHAPLGSTGRREAMDNNVDTVIPRITEGGRSVRWCLNRYGLLRRPSAPARGGDRLREQGTGTSRTPTFGGEASAVIRAARCSATRSA